MQITGLNLLGSTSSGQGQHTFQASNPSNGELLPTIFHEATSSEVNLAVTLAEAAYPAYRQKSDEERAKFLVAIAEEILAAGEELLSICSQETALSLGRLTGERGRTMGQLKLFAQVVREGKWRDLRIDHADPSRQPAPKPDLRQTQIPLGPVGIFGASNFPLAFSVAGGDTASALAAGCPVIVKAHPMHPATSALVGQAILRAAKKTGMPNGVFSLIHGNTHAAGMALVEHPLITAIGFTGSFRGGKAIFDAANRRPNPIPVFAEMGSANPVFILPAALAQQKAKIAADFLHSLTLGVGQFCTNPGLIITTDNEDTTEFSQLLGDAVSGAKPGIMLGANIKQNYLQQVAKLAANATVTKIANSATMESENACQAYYFTAPAQTLVETPAIAEEVFGPTTLHLLAKEKKALVDIAQQLEGHLTATIIGTEAELANYADLIQVLSRKVGRLIFNGFPTGVEVSPAMVHGGPFPATTAPQTTSVGTAAIRRFARPICYQGFPQAALPLELRDA